MADRDERIARFYSSYRSAIYRQCRRMLAADAEDAVQDVFVRLATNLEAAPANAALPFWIQRIVRNHCLNEIRNERRRRRLHSDSLAREPSSRSRVGEILEARDLVRRVVSRAPDRLTVVAWLHHVEGQTQEEVGQTLGLSRRTIVTCLAEIRRRATKAAAQAR
jgi:RNA polymerase sigma-70 factor (ECF subfamily)